MTIRIKLKGQLEEPRDAAVIATFLQSKRGRKLLKRIVRTEPGRDLVRALKKEPGGKKALRSLFNDEMPKVRRRRGRDERRFTAQTGRDGRW